MTQDEPNSMETAASTDGGASAPADGTDLVADDGDVTTYLYWGALGVLALLALLAVFRFYTSASAAIGVWIAPRFEPVVRAAFNFAVLLAAGIGISLVVRRLRV